MKVHAKMYVRSKSQPIEFDYIEFYEAFGMVNFVIQKEPAEVYRIPMSEVLWISASEIQE